MGTCGTCKHWGKENDAGEAFRPCRAVIHDKSDLTGSYGDEFLTDEPFD